MRFFVFLSRPPEFSFKGKRYVISESDSFKLYFCHHPPPSLNTEPLDAMTAADNIDKDPLDNLSIFERISELNISLIQVRIYLKILTYKSVQ